MYVIAGADAVFFDKSNVQSDGGCNEVEISSLKMGWGDISNTYMQREDNRLVFIV